MEELHQRHISPISPISPRLSTHKVNSVVKKLDMFPKVGDDYIVKTNEGAYVTIITGIIMIILLISELYTFSTVNRSDFITVRNSSDEHIFINFNITLYNITCQKVLFDLTDEDGLHPLGSSSRLIKVDLDKNGSVIGLNRKSISYKSSQTCGSCYGAGYEGQCCNSCTDLIQAYYSRGWDPYYIEKLAPLCTKEQSIKIFSPHVGCMIWGAVDVNQVAGNIHISTRTGMISPSGKQVYDEDIIYQLVSSHYIDHFTFGDHVPGVSNPLDSHKFHTSAVTSHEYYIEVLPLLYKNSKKQINSNEYSVYEVDHNVTIGKDALADYEPGIFFNYKISPFSHVIKETKHSWSYLLIRICAVIGGTMAISRFLDLILYKLIRVY